VTARVALIVLLAALAIGLARGGHEQPVYPSYYPQEIEIARVAPQAAADLLSAGKLHAYVGVAPFAVSTSPNSTLGFVESLGSFVIVRLNPASPLAADETSACAAASAIVRGMAGLAGAGAITVHPYPITPWHGDYLSHIDRAEAERARMLGGDAPPLRAFPRVRASSELARSLIPAQWLTAEADWDAAIEEMSVAAIVRASTVALNGWLGPAQLRAGWFHATRVLGGAPWQDEARALLARLEAGEGGSSVERINLERELVRSLLAGCRTIVAGYTLKQEPFNAQYSAGIENISYDALEGLSSPMFLRTVKLKDFPWNGWLQLGIAAEPDSAWNPIGGFTDPFGRLAWYALSDAAAIPSPYEAGWTLNRISDIEATPRK
jgi:hypothetical protein